MARQAGYSVTIKLFIPVEQNDINDVLAKAKAIQAAENGDLSRVMDEAQVEEFKQAFTSRNTGTGRAGSEEDQEAQSASRQHQRGGRFGRAAARFEEITLN